MFNKIVTIIKIEKILFYIFLFLIPLQLRGILYWNNNEWDSIFLYLTDLFLIGFLFLAIINKRISFKKTDILLFLFLLIAGISIFVSTDSGVSIYRFIKLAEFVGLFLYVKTAHRSDKSYGSYRSYIVLIAAGLLQSVLAIAQFYKQSSLGLKFIEAGTYAPGAPGVATFIMGDDKIMRAYGSFPHPNVLAAFLLLAIFCFYYLWISTFLKGKFRYMLYVTCYMIMVFSLFLTFSRGPILVFIFMSIIFLLVRFFQLRQLYHTEERLLAGKRLMFLALFFVVFSVLSTIILLPYIKNRFFTISLQEEAIDLRFFYNKIALVIIKEKPLLGVGIGNFVNYSQHYPAFLRAANAMLSGGGQGDVEIPDWLYQPVHNIYLLIASEIGILGALLFLLFLAKKAIQGIKQIFRELNEINALFFLFIGFLILGLSDHYFWTLQSGSLMFWLSLALISPHSLTDKAQPSGG